MFCSLPTAILWGLGLSLIGGIIGWLLRNSRITELQGLYDGQRQKTVQLQGDYDSSVSSLGLLQGRYNDMEADFTNWKSRYQTLEGQHQDLDLSLIHI